MVQHYLDCLVHHLDDNGNPLGIYLANWLLYVRTDCQQHCCNVKYCENFVDLAFQMNLAISCHISEFRYIIHWRMHPDAKFCTSVTVILATCPFSGPVQLGVISKQKFLHIVS